MIYPPRCPACSQILPAGAEMICPECLRKLPLVEGAVCMKCGKPIESTEREYCLDCERHPHRFEEGRAALIYEREARGAVDRLKFYNRRDYVPFFGALLEELSRETFPRWNPDCLIPVPMHPKKRAQRGYDQAALLACELGKRSGLPVREDLLIRIRRTEASKNLGRAGRKKNLRGAFAVREESSIPETAVLIDDIYTTGATMDEAGYALQSAGVKHIFFLTVCTGRGMS